LRQRRAITDASDQVTKAYGCELPVERDAISLTDWIESIMLVEELCEISETDLRGRLVEQGGNDSDGQAAPGRQQVEDVLREVERRSRHAPGSYPFQRGRYGITLANKRLLQVYAFLLWLSLPNSPFHSKIYSNEVTPLFDYLGEAALVTLLGPGARAIRFGWPVSGDRPTGPRKALVWLTGHMRVTHDPTAPISPTLKDGGVDVVLWRPFSDGRGGFPIILAQCTVGRSEWQRKGQDIKRALWRRYLGLGWDPATTLVVPFCVQEPDRFKAWDIACHDVSFIVDRLRLLELLDDVDSADIPHREQIEQWTSDRAQELALS
jgi:hypothetical protein